MIRLPSLEDLVASPWPSATVGFDGGNLELVLRKPKWRGEDVLIDVARVEALRTRTGSMTRFLDRYEPLGIFVECVVEPYFGRWLEEVRGYGRITSAEAFPCYFKPTDRSRMDADLAATAESLSIARAEARLSGSDGRERRCPRHLESG